MISLWTARTSATRASFTPTANLQDREPNFTQETLSCSSQYFVHKKWPSPRPCLQRSTKLTGLSNGCGCTVRPMWPAVGILSPPRPTQPWLLSRLSCRWFCGKTETLFQRGARLMHGRQTYHDLCTPAAKEEYNLWNVWQSFHTPRNSLWNSLEKSVAPHSWVDQVPFCPVFDDHFEGDAPSAQVGRIRLNPRHAGSVSEEKEQRNTGKSPLLFLLSPLLFLFVLDGVGYDPRQATHRIDNTANLVICRWKPDFGATTNLNPQSCYSVTKICPTRWDRILMPFSKSINRKVRRSLVLTSTGCVRNGTRQVSNSVHYWSRPHLSHCGNHEDSPEENQASNHGHWKRLQNVRKCTQRSFVSTQDASFKFKLIFSTTCAEDVYSLQVTFLENLCF